MKCSNCLTKKIRQAGDDGVDYETAIRRAADATDAITMLNGETMCFDCLLAYRFTVYNIIDPAPVAPKPPE